MKTFFISLFLVCAQFAFSYEYAFYGMDSFSDLLPEREQKQQAALENLDQVNHLFELSASLENKNSSACVDTLAKKQQAQFVEVHHFEDLKVKKSILNKK